MHLRQVIGMTAKEREDYDKSREHWTGPHTVFDRKKRYPVTLYSAPIEFVQFIEIQAAPKINEAA
jgi:hypothetical protein